MTDQFLNNEARHRYELHASGGMALAYYEQRGDALAFVHTIVPVALRGRGLANTLIEAALADVRERGLKVIAECPFVTEFIARHPEDQDLLASDSRS